MTTPQQPDYGFTQGDPRAAMPVHQQGNGMAVAGLVLGIVALVLCWVPFLNWVLGLLGTIFGAVGISKANKIGGRGKGLAISGLILGVIALILGSAFVVWLWREAEKEIRYDRDRYGVIVPAQPDVG